MTQPIRLQPLLRELGQKPAYELEADDCGHLAGQGCGVKRADELKGSVKEHLILFGRLTMDCRVVPTIGRSARLIASFLAPERCG